ncbi:hypothetical protein ABEB36_011220 [Hypothenemus hampei]|uniref:PH domain-containing protein n=1 Tax=Hypothenemus hampei TaxID=57062 RepID=A0ABD1EEM0_HYPHA
MMSSTPKRHPAVKKVSLNLTWTCQKTFHPKITPQLPTLKKDLCIDLLARQTANVKSGALLMRRKMFSIIDRSTKVFCAVHEHYLLIYWSFKEAKPFLVLDLTEYEAKEDHECLYLLSEDILKQNKSKITWSFKVFLTNCPQKNGYNFIASTHNDMLQWVININRAHDKAVNFGKEDQLYEICQEECEENIYNEIDSKTFKEMPSEEPPELPAKLTKSNIEQVYQELDGNEAEQNYFEISPHRKDNSYVNATIVLQSKFNKIQWKPWSSCKKNGPGDKSRKPLADFNFLDKEENEKPMVLLKGIGEEEVASKKLKKALTKNRM